jgi:hypothetical protein
MTPKLPEPEPTPTEPTRRDERLEGGDESDELLRQLAARDFSYLDGAKLKDLRTADLDAS